MTTSCDVVVVGAGPTGLTLALQATLMGADVRILDRRSGPRAWAPALAIHPRTMEILRGLGVADQLLARGLSRVDLKIHFDSSMVGGSLGELRLPATEYPFIFFAPQPEVEAELIERLAALGVEVEWDATFEGFESADGVMTCRVEVRGVARLINTRFLVGCDGADSAVRRESGISFRGRNYRESIVVADAGPTADLDSGTANAFLGAGGILFFFPLPSGRWRLIGPASGGDSPAEIQALARLLTRGKVDVSDIRSARVVTPQHRLASNYRRGRVFIAGDAAHVHSPAGAQGMNTGIQDAANLGWKLGLVLRGAPDRLLDSYETERRSVAKQVVRLTGLAFAVEVSEFAPLRWGRRWAARPVATLLLSHPGTMSLIARIVSGLDTRYRRGAVAASPGGSSRYQSGKRLPDGDIEDGGPSRLHRLIESSHFHLVVLDEAIGAFSVDRLRETYGSILSIHRPGSLPMSQRSGPAWVLVRPDGYIATSAASDAALDRADEYLSEWLGPHPVDGRREALK